MGGGYPKTEFEACYKTQNQHEAVVNGGYQVITTCIQFGEKYSHHLATCIGIGILNYDFTHITVTHLDIVKCKMQIEWCNLFDEMTKRKLGSWNTIIIELVDFGNYLEMSTLFLLLGNEFLDCGSHTFTTVI